MINWFQHISRFYEQGNWKLWQVAFATKSGTITPEEFKTITGKVYTEEMANQPK